MMQEGNIRKGFIWVGWLKQGCVNLVALCNDTWLQYALLLFVFHIMLLFWTFYFSYTFGANKILACD